MKQRGNNTQLTPGDATKRKPIRQPAARKRKKNTKKTPDSSSAIQRNFSFCSTQFSITSTDGKNKVHIERRASESCIRKLAAWSLFTGRPFRAPLM